MRRDSFRAGESSVLPWHEVRQFLLDPVVALTSHLFQMSPIEILGAAPAIADHVRALLLTGDRGDALATNAEHVGIAASRWLRFGSASFSVTGRGDVWNAVASIASAESGHAKHLREGSHAFDCARNGHATGIWVEG